jgi:hypothetical protein
MIEAVLFLSIISTIIGEWKNIRIEMSNRWAWVNANVKVTQYNTILLDDGLVMFFSWFHATFVHSRSSIA